MTIIKLISKGVQESIARLAGTKKQAFDAISIGSTVQPIVDVNLGIKRYFSGSLAGNGTVNIVVPNDKIYRIAALRIFLDTDSSVANRRTRLSHLMVDDINNFYTVIVRSGADVAADSTDNVYTDRVSVGSQITTYGTLQCANIFGVNFVAGDIIRIDCVNGVAGDALNYYIKVLEFEAC